MLQMQERPASVTTPLSRGAVYRPGGAVALLVLVVPVAFAGAVIEAYLVRGHTIPLWAAGVALAWVLSLPLLWLSLKTVRVDALGIEAGRPWQTWSRITWDSVARVERRGARLRVTSRDYARISFNPGLLHRGTVLRAFLLLQVPSELLDDALRDEARGVVIVNAGKADAGQLPGMFRARPHIGLRVVAAIFTFACLGAVPASVVYLPEPIAIAAAAAGVLGSCVGVIASHWLWQRVTLSDAGLTVVGPVTGRPRGMQWSQIVLIEYTPKGRAIRVTGMTKDVQVSCPGPGVMRTLEATIYRAYLVRNLLDRRVMEVERVWLP